MAVEKSVVRIISKSNKIVGCGFLSDTGRILTCAHVVRAALGLSSTPKTLPDGTITLGFPLIQAGHTLSARVVRWNAVQDIAGLELLEPSPEITCPAPLVYGSHLWGHPFKAFGFPAGYELGVWADGEMRGPNAAGWIQIDDTTPIGYFIQQGFSGGPVWDEKLQGVVGMVVQGDSNPSVRSASMIPMDMIYCVWPDLPKPAGTLGVMHEVPAPPEKYLPRPEDIKAIKSLILGQPEQSTAILGKSLSIGLHGMGGIGKSVLAAVVVQEPEIRRAFPNGLIWLTLGQEPNLTARQEDLARVLGEKEAFKDHWQGRSRLRELLKDKNCLLILDDVWEFRHVVDAFDCLDSNSRVLLTTRDQGIVTSLKATPYTVDLLSETQSLQLLADWAGQNTDGLPPEASEIVKECGCLPLALAMVGAIVQHNPESWGKALRRLQKADLEKIQQQFPNYPYSDLLKAIQVSIDALPVTWRERYFDFAVFPEDALIPPSVLRTLWISSEIDGDDVDDILGGLVKRSMARRDNQGRLFLHDLQRDYVRRQIQNHQELHNQLVNAYRMVCQPKENSISPWAGGPNDGYFTNHITHHLVTSQRWQEVYQLLCDFHFLESRCQESSIYDVLSDFRLAIDNWKGDERELIGLEQFERCLRLHAGTISQAPNLLFSILANHMVWVTEPEETATLCLGQTRGRKGWLRSVQNPEPVPPLWHHSLVGHTGGINSIAVTPDGSQILSGSNDKTVKLWDFETGRLLSSFVGHTELVSAVAVTPDGHRVISGSWDNTIKVWDLQSGQLILSLVGHTDRVTSIAIVPDNRTLVSGSEDKTLKIWDLGTGRLLRSIEGHKGGINSLAITPDSRMIVSGGEQREIMVWDLKSGALIRSFDCHGTNITALAISPIGDYLITTTENNLKVWNLKTGRFLYALLGHGDFLNSIKVTSDNLHVVAGGTKGYVYIWDFQNRNCESLYKHTDMVTTIATSPDGKLIFSASEDRSIKVWEIESEQIVRALEGASSQSKPTIHPDPEGRQMVQGVEETSLTKGIDNKQLIRSIEGHSRGVSTVAITPDNCWVISAAGDRLLQWDILNGNLERNLTRYADRVVSLVLTPDGREIISGGWDRTARRWDLQQKRQKDFPTKHTDWITAIAISPNGRKLISGSMDKTVKVWEVESGRMLCSLEGHNGSVDALTTSFDGSRVISGSSDHTIRVWDPGHARMTRILVGHNNRVTGLALMPDGNTLVSVSADRSLRLWNLNRGAIFHTFIAHSAAINAIVLYHSSHRALTCSDDKTIRLWDLDTGSSKILFWNDSPINCLALSKDARYLAAGDSAGRVWIFEWVH